MASNILGNDPSRPDLSNKAIHLRPEMSFIFLATPSSCHAEGLAWVCPSRAKRMSSAQRVKSALFFSVSEVTCPPFFAPPGG